MSYFTEKLTNGVFVRACRMEGTHTITIIVMLSGGVVWESAGKRGITHLTEHLCFRRVAGVSQEDFYYRIESLGTELRGITCRDRVLFEITVNPRYFNEAVDLLRDLFEPNRWTYEDIRREKSVVCRQIEDANDYCFETMISDFFNESFAGNPIMGTRNKLEKITKSQIEAHKKELFSSNNTEIILCGDINTRHISYIIDKFSSVEKTSDKESAIIVPRSFLNRNKRLDRYFCDDSSMVKIGFTFDVDTNKVSRVEAEMLFGLLFKGLLTPFTMRLREDLGLLHEIQSNLEFYSFGGLLYLIFCVNKEHSFQLLDEVIRILTMQKECVDKKAFDCIYSAYTDGANELFDNTKSFAYELAFDEQLSTPMCYIERNRQVTYEQICKAIKEVFKSQNMIVSINDAPADFEYRNKLYEKVGILRKALKC